MHIILKMGRQSAKFSEMLKISSRFTWIRAKP